ncbi:formimidoylglutamase [Gemmata sp.]|uniref:formimidoylglutamase n=1 Tax=Gemmata sp. TaxID=1914242 RepID=UPI003F6E9E38
MPEPDMSVWTGRVDTADGPDALRWHQMVKPLTPGGAPGVVLVGFACDEGVRRNGGRVGVKDGPHAIRTALANLAWHQAAPVYDAGDVRCDDADMEGAQSRLAEVVADAIRSGHRPLVLGGGHETAWGTFQGIVAAKPEANVGVINIDAHLDLRADEPGNSGTPFYQMAKWCNPNGKPFRYLCVGVAEPSNTLALFGRARELGVRWHRDADIVAWNLDGVVRDMADLGGGVDLIHLSIDLDVLPAATMPAVSAPAARGVALEIVLPLVAGIIRNLKVAAVDVVEFNPHLDPAGCAARVAARIAWQAAEIAEELS